jgi:spore coat protein U-like protein
MKYCGAWLWLGLSCLALSASPVRAACQVSNVSALAFGSYNVLSPTDKTITGSFNVRNCSGGARTYTATFSAGNGTLAARALRSGVNTLGYNIYKDAAYTQILGSGSGGTATIANTNSGSGTGPTHTLYGLIPAGQDVPAGSYTDTLTITITF